MNGRMYRNKKNQTDYLLIDASIMNATNGQDFEPMALYSNQEGEKFTRPLKEFHEKFDLMICPSGVCNGTLTACSCKTGGFSHPKMTSEQRDELFDPTELGMIVGEVCGRKGCNGILKDTRAGNGCSCHNFNPPCSYCTDNSVACSKCDWEYEE